MKVVALTDARNLEALLDEAQREPVVIRRQKRDVAVILSMADFERMRSANVRAFLDTSKKVAERAKSRGLTYKRLQELLADDK